MANYSESNTNNADLSFFNIINNNHTLINHGDEEEDNYYTYTYALINGCTLPMVMKATIDLGLLKLIHNHVGPNGLSPEEIASRLNISNPNAPAMLDRMLRVLATYFVVRCTTVTTADAKVVRQYSSSPVTKFLVPNEDGVSLAGSLNLFVDKVFLESWSKLDKAVIEGGIPFNMAHGIHAFEYPRVDPRFNQVFNDAMYQTTTSVVKKILDKYNGFENIKQLVDVGGGIGHTLRVVTSKYPSIKGVNFDLPHVIENAPPCSGVEHVAGDMFQKVPQGDSIFMKVLGQGKHQKKWILHDWSDEHCLMLLKNCYKALSKNGKVIVVEMTMEDEASISPFGRAISQLDVLMMTQNPGGKERSKREFKALANEAGFSTVNFCCCVLNFWVMEFCI